MEDDEWRSAAFLESLLAASVAVVVTDGATTRQDVRIRLPNSVPPNSVSPNSVSPNSISPNED